jgi:O-methyltransferase involved in polyketide biosynthesis
MPTTRKIKVELEGVPETLLWTLYHRALEARRPDAVFRDPKAIELVDAIDYPFDQRLDQSHLGIAQGHALRVQRFDDEIRTFLSKHPDATVVALGAGLETQFERVDNGRVHWVSVDLPHIAELRRQLLPETERQRIIACSAVEERWMNEIDGSRPVLVTAQAMLMYLHPADVHWILSACAQRFRGGAMLFDGVPLWFSTAASGGILRARKLKTPAMPWGVNASERQRIARTPGIAELRELQLPAGRGFFFSLVMPWLQATAPTRHQFPISLFFARFAQ